jgi:hypothetical protein
MSAAVAERRTTAGMKKEALRFAPRITLSMAADGWLSELPLIRRRPGRPDARTAGVICEWRKPERDMVTTAGLCRCQRQAWRYEISQLMGRDREGASDLALGARKVRRLGHVTTGLEECKG